MPKSTPVDTPKVHTSLAALQRERPEGIEPFQLALEDSRIITFPDLFELDYEKAETVMRGAQSGTIAPSEALRLWLSEKDAAALFDRPRSFRDLLAILQAAQAHYEGVYGHQGEGVASRG